MLGEISVPFLAPFKLSLMTESKEDVEVETGNPRRREDLGIFIFIFIFSGLLSNLS